MQVASRFSIAVHLLSLLGLYEEQSPSSEWLAGSIGVNSVIVRNVTAMLRKAGLVQTQQGIAGARLARPLSEITLLDVYRAVHAVDADGLFAFHSMPNPDCPVGANIQTALMGTFREAQRAMEERLAARTIAAIVGELQQVSKNGEES